MAQFRKLTAAVAINILVLFHFGTVIGHAQGVGNVLTQILDLDSLADVLDGSGDLPDGTLDTLDRQIEALRAETFYPVDYKLDDYAVSIGSNLGVGDRVHGELSAKISLIKLRTEELSQLSARNEELAEIEFMYDRADLALSDGANVLEDYLENGGLAADQVSGYPVFNNLQVIRDKLEPRFSDRLSEVKRARKEIKRRIDTLQEHLNDANGVVEYYEDVLSRIERAAALPEAGASSEAVAALEQIKKRREEVVAAAGAIERANAETRQRVKAILEEQQKARRRNKLIGDVLSVVQIGLGAYGLATENTVSSPTPSTTTVNVDIRSTTIIISPVDPGNGLPIRGSDR